GHKVATLLINMPKHYVLPGSTRKFTQSLDKSAIGDKMLFGRYTVKMEVNYGNNQRLVENTSFIVIPWRLIGGAIIALIVLFFVLRTLLRRYNQHIIKQARKR
ncbi:MAG TPA: hypothetical protein VFK03_00110, partial [Candidatus Saccharimonadales bacterium]|nr:hypothetical protein [Candidatus Saccharimonadales bacterium]